MNINMKEGKESNNIQRKKVKMKIKIKIRTKIKRKIIFITHQIVQIEQKNKKRYKNITLKINKK